MYNHFVTAFTFRLPEKKQGEKYRNFYVNSFSKVKSLYTNGTVIVDSGFIPGKGRGTSRPKFVRLCPCFSSA